MRMMKLRSLASRLAQNTTTKTTTKTTKTTTTTTAMTMTAMARRRRCSAALVEPFVEAMPRHLLPMGTTMPIRRTLATVSSRAAAAAATTTTTTTPSAPSPWSSPCSSTPTSRRKNWIPFGTMGSSQAPGFTSSSSSSSCLFSTSSTSSSASSTPMEKMEFQAETRQLLDIVTHSLYTDREVFLRELVSNASDALEKLRHVQSASSASTSTSTSSTSDEKGGVQADGGGGGGGDGTTIDPDLPLHIKITTDEMAGTITISDTGIGLTKDEMVSNLGTIARSGSKAFLSEMAATMRYGSDAAGGEHDPSKGIIGKFGVGFYSSFMVGEKVEVVSRSAYVKHADELPKIWTSDGSGTYEIGDYEVEYPDPKPILVTPPTPTYPPELEDTEQEGDVDDATADAESDADAGAPKAEADAKSPDPSKSAVATAAATAAAKKKAAEAAAEAVAKEQPRGSSVTIHLKEDAKEFCQEKRVEEVLKKYSNFVGFPIYLNDILVNTLEAVWAKDPKTVDDETYSAFFKYVSGAYDEPLDRLHFRSDAPIDIKALLFIPAYHGEKYGAGRIEPGVSLYSRKVLIDSKSTVMLPEWLRFVRGVVDSEDLPLSVSREKPQDSSLMTKLRTALTRKFLSHLATMAKKHPELYKEEFYPEYHAFLKEGVCQDVTFKEQIAKLLFFETSKSNRGEMSSFSDYISRCPPEQEDIYFLSAPSRELALQSPYMEAFESSGREVLLIYSAIDDFVMNNLETFEGKRLVSIEKGDVDVGTLNKKKKKKKEAKDGESAEKEEEEEDEEEDDDDDNNNNTSGVGLTSQEASAFCSWFQSTVGPSRVETCKATNRLTTSPAIVTDNESSSVRRMMKFVEMQQGGGGDSGAVTPVNDLPPQQIQINPKHPIIVGLNKIREDEPILARVCAEQVYDNCLIGAGILDDGRTMLPRLNDLLLTIVKDATGEDYKSPTRASHLKDDGKPKNALNIGEDYQNPNFEGDYDPAMDDSESARNILAHEEGGQAFPPLEHHDHDHDHVGGVGEEGEGDAPDGKRPEGIPPDEWSDDDFVDGYPKDLGDDDEDMSDDDDDDDDDDTKGKGKDDGDAEKEDDEDDSDETDDEEDVGKGDGEGEGDQLGEEPIIEDDTIYGNDDEVITKKIEDMADVMEGDERSQWDVRKEDDSDDEAEDVSTTTTTNDKDSK